MDHIGMDAHTSRRRQREGRRPTRFPHLIDIGSHDGCQRVIAQEEIALFFWVVFTTL